MTSEQNDIQNKQKVLDVLPLNKGRRILLFLGDFFLNFVLSFVMFSLMILPLGKVITNYTGRQEQAQKNLSLRSDILKENKLLFFNDDAEKIDVLYNASFTFYCFFSYFVYDDENPVNARYEQYGHKVENDIFRHYFTDIAHEENKYYDFFDLYNKNQYFERSGDEYTMNSELKTLIFPYFDKSDEPSEDADKKIGEMEDSFFYPMYSEMISMVENKTDLHYNGYSYNDLQKKILAFDNYSNNLAVVTAYITLLVSTGILYLLVPLINKNHKTVTMMIMKLERVNKENLEIVKTPKVVINFVYALLSSLLIAFFIPAVFVTIYGIFNIPILMIFGLLSVALILASFVFLLFSAFNMDLFDFLTGTVLLKTSALDDIYRAKGYYI